MTEFRIEVGELEFDADSIILSSMAISTAVDIAGAELAADVFSVILTDQAGEGMLFSPKGYDGIFTSDGYLFGTAEEATGDLTATPYGTPVKLFGTGRQESGYLFSPADYDGIFTADGNLFGTADAAPSGAGLIAKFYVHDIRRVGKTQYQLNAMSAIGLLEFTRHMGAVYSDITVSQLMDEIIDDTFDYSIDPTVSGQKVAGWLPIDSSRNNLHKLMFAMGITALKDENGDVYFTFLGSSAAAVPDDRIFLGGTVGYPSLVTGVELTEHAWFKGATTAQEQIFSNVGDVVADHLFVPFSAPYWDVEAEGLTINELGDNYAIVTGTGILRGKPYLHEEKILRQSIPGTTALVPNVITSSEDALVNSLNSLNVLERLAAFYGSRKTVAAEILPIGEKAGSVISFSDAFGDTELGIISQMDARVSSIIRAQCTIVTDYTPTGQGNLYLNRALISSSGSWTVPAGVTKIRVVLIGGGQGGCGGFDGSPGAGGMADPDWGIAGDMSGYWARDDGPLGSYYASGKQPIKPGGDGGEPGAPGRVYVADVDVEAGESITLTVGAGGAGGAANGEAGMAGTASTAASASLGTLSSDLGAASLIGFYDAFTGDVFAAMGRKGYAGAPGGMTDTVSLSGWNGAAGLPGGDFSADYEGGAGGAGESAADGDYRASGGGGGGAAYGADGEDGTDGTISTTESEHVVQTYYDVQTGSGGKGADALPPAQAFYGFGGTGGNGGGGGGNAGGGYSATYFTVYNDFFSLGTRGEPGNGSAGGVGGAGCVIIYW